jgi:hypothetical protein
MGWQAITLNDTISKGDHVNLTFTIGIPFAQDSQMEALWHEIETDSRFQVVSLNRDEDRIYLQVLVKESPLPLLALVTVVIGASSLLFLFLSFERGERVLKHVTTATREVAAAVSPVVWGIAAIAFLWFAGPMFRRLMA